jgi:hypothetical protein
MKYEVHFGLAVDLIGKSQEEAKQSPPETRPAGFMLYR